MKDLELKLEEGANTQGEAGSADQSLCRWDPATVLALGEAGSASQLPSLSPCITWPASSVYIANLNTEVSSQERIGYWSTIPSCKFGMLHAFLQENLEARQVFD